MIASKIKIDNCVYYHLHAEQVVQSAFINGAEIRISDSMVNDNVFNQIITDYSGFSKDKKEILVLNFDSIDTIQNNQNKKISELKKLNQNLVFINIKKKLVEELGLDSLFNNFNNTFDDNRDFLIFYCIENVNFNNIITSTDEIFKIEFLKLLTDEKKGYIHTLANENKYHASSSVYLDKWINFKKFISLDKTFFLYAIYRLALKTYYKWFNEIDLKDENSKPILVCQNLNSSYITSILSTFLKTDIIILDQIGPINKMYSTLDNKIENDKKYIVVSDLVCLGTEIKIAKSLIEFLGGNYIGNISMVRIQTIKPEHKKFTDTECVFVIDKKVNEKIGYKISTDLDE